ncbi:MAG: DUF1631 family protein [Marinobacter sp.]|uniref:DUF1631 family protein n=1 Tax=Marinobacter sp. TaxID=50741 RepID=UPI00299ED32B|nr:DUF1631 family protein [Marinobacter sp.]MDX1633610.1 DUF1631 family protein [Marinobacter sp.]
MPTADRRHHYRHPVRHEALVVARGFDPVGCELANVCAGGMWLENLPSGQLLTHLAGARAPVLEVHLFLTEAGRERHVRAMARVRRVSGTSIGVAFLYPAQELVESLIRNQPTHRRLAIVDSATRQRLWQLLEECCRELMGRLLQTTAEETLGLVRARLEQSGSLPDVTELKGLRKLLTTQGGRLERAFRAYWQPFLQALDNGDAPVQPRPKLAVVDKVLFEDWLELQAVASSLVTGHRNRCFQINQAVAQLALTDINERSNPLAPIPLCQCLQYAAFQAGLESGARHLLYQGFRAALNEHWPVMVRALLESFRQHGLRVLDMEQLPLTWPSEPASRAGLEVTDRPDPVAAGAGNGTIRNGDTDRSAVLRMMALVREPDRVPVTPAASAGELMSQLQPLRAALGQKLAQHQGRLTRLLEHAGQSHPQLMQALGSQDWDRAGLVDRLFDPLAASPRLRDNLKQQLDQLKLPVFEVMLSNPAFLGDESHPARAMVNDLMSLCLAERISSQHLERTVSDVIDRLVSADRLDDGLFRELGGRLRTLVQRQEQSFLRNAERIAKTLEGQQRLSEARQHVRLRLNDLLAGQQVPSVVLDLLAEGWDQLMVLTLLKEGPESAALSEQFDLLAQLLAWLGPDAGREELAFERELESGALLQMVERSLASLGHPQGQRDVLRRLAAELSDEAPSPRQEVVVYPVGESHEAPPPVPAPDASRWSRRAHQLQVGDWIAERQPNGSYKRMRLVWGGRDVYRFVFLTSQGMHEVDFQLHELVERFERGEIALVEQDEVPFIDQSLYDIVQDLHREMTHRATHDPLTGCMHRHEFEKQLGLLLGRLRSDEMDGGLLCFDIDQFSVVNASYGTAAGDSLLKSITDLIRQARPEAEHNLLGRLGGNEFGLALAPVATADLLDLAERLRKSIREARFRHDDKEFPTTVSISVNPFSPESPESSEVLNQSNLALKGAKKAGGDRVELVGVGQQQNQKTMLSWVSTIDRTLEKGGLSLRAQRIAPIDGAQDLPSYEILLGLTDDRGREVSPQPFIEAAEHYRRSARVDRWVVEHTFDWMAANPAQVEALGALNINLSGASLSDDGFLAYLEQRVRQGQVPAEKLCFEVTETAAVANLHYVADFMMEMKRLRCRFALDDFGTGLSSYAYLQQLPVDFVKIDGVFIRGLADNLTNYAMVRSINELSHFLGARTIAEYVEDMETLEALREIRVDYAQGFGIARPKPLESLSQSPVASRPAGS